MARKMTLDQVAERLVEIKERKGELAAEGNDLSDEQAELEETFKMVATKRDIRGVPIGTFFVGISRSKVVEITDEAKLAKAIKARKWEKKVLKTTTSLVKTELDKLVKAEKKQVPGTRIKETERVQVRDRKENE